MDPHTQFCHNLDCPARGLVGHGNIQIQSRAERRYDAPPAAGPSRRPGGPPTTENGPLTTWSLWC